jgi:zinc transporter ZupT
MSNEKDNGTSQTSLIILLGYLISSIFAGLIFSALAMRAKSNGGSGIGWGILSLICIAIFGYMGYAVYFTSSPSVDSFWYYFGLISLISNSLALFILILALFKRNDGLDSRTY